MKMGRVSESQVKQFNQMFEERDCVTVRMEYLLNHLPTFTPSKPIIDKVADHLRQVSVKDFEPRLVSIGPIHREKDSVKSIEQHKVRYLRLLLQRRDRFSIQKCVLELRSLEEKARLCYPTSINLDKNEFVEMLLLDGVFVIELIRYYWFDYLREKNDQIFQFDHTLSQIRHDLMLLENQLPFFVLNKLFDMTKMEDPEDDIYQLLLFFVKDMFPWSNASILDSKSHILHNADHLLGLAYQSCYSTAKQSNSLHMFSASDLEEAGIQTKLPPLNVSDKTESILRNLIAYEHCFPNDHPKCVTKYALFMNCLIRSTKDVQILRRHEIIGNFLGSDDMIYLMINRLGENVVVSSDFIYSDVIESVKMHERWMAKQKRKYFNSPLVVISFVLLLLLFIQTLFTVLSYRKL